MSYTYLVSVTMDKELTLKTIKYNLSNKLKVLVTLIVNAGFIRRIVDLLIFAHRNWFQLLFIIIMIKDLIIIPHYNNSK